MGWEFIDDIVWSKPAPSVKNRNGGFFRHRTPLAYKPNSITEYVIVYRKQTDKLIDWNIAQYPEELVAESRITGEYEKTNVWKITPSRDKVHPATFPLTLAGMIIEFYSMKNDLVFDPFAGKGTLGQAAQILDRAFLLIEKNPVYINRASEFLNLHSMFHKTRFTLHNREEFIDSLKN